MAYNKIIYGEKTLIDLTGDSVTKDVLFNGVVAHDKSGNVITGTLFSGYPSTVTILKKSSLSSINKKEANIVKYQNKILLDLSGDTVTEDTLLFGYRCHRKDGTIINGSFLKDYPSTIEFSDIILDSNGNAVLDSNGNTIKDTIIYTKSISGNNIVYTKT